MLHTYSNMGVMTTLSHLVTDPLTLKRKTPIGKIANLLDYEVVEKLQRRYAVHLIQWNLRREEMQKYAVDKNSENLQKPLKQSVRVCDIIAFHILNRMILSTCRRNAVPLLS